MLPWRAGRDGYIAHARPTWRKEYCSSAVRLGMNLEDLVEMRRGKVVSLELEEGSTQTYIGHNTNIPRPILGGVMDLVTRIAQILVKRLLPKNLSPRAPVPNQSYYGFQTTGTKHLTLPRQLAVQDDSRSKTIPWARLV